MGQPLRGGVAVVESHDANVVGGAQLGGGEGGPMTAAERRRVHLREVDGQAVERVVIPPAGLQIEGAPMQGRRGRGGVVVAADARERRDVGVPGQIA